MKAELNFDEGSIDGLFVVYLKSGSRLYATKLIKLPKESILRCVVYSIRANGSMVNAGGEMRPALDIVEKIEIKGVKY